MVWGSNLDEDASPPLSPPPSAKGKAFSSKKLLPEEKATPPSSHAALMRDLTPSGKKNNP